MANTDVNNADISVIFDKIFPENMSWDAVSNKLFSLKEHPRYEELTAQFCYMLVTRISEGYVRYDSYEEIENNDEFFALIKKHIKELDTQKHEYTWMFYYIIIRDNISAQNYLEKAVESFEKLVAVRKLEFTESDFLNNFLVPYKQAYDGFWEYLCQNIDMFNPAVGVKELCELVSEFYKAKNIDEVLEMLQGYVQKFPEIYTANEWLGFTYYQKKMWNNAIACFENSEAFFFYPDQIYFFMGYAYGKIKDSANEELYYKKALENYPEAELVRNNLGYCLYKQKRYDEAIALFEECIEKKIDLPYAAHNYITTLIASGRNKAAKKFVKDTDIKIYRTYRDKVEKLPDYDFVSKKVNAKEDIDEEESAPFKDLGIKRKQFQSEKILEDELTARIEAGIPVFGMKLKVYKRKGEYGRQYIIPIGRLDLLCEDDNGNIYIIELKKDSGYKDGYEQICEYLYWFDTSEKFKGKNVKGILCLNSPTKAMIDKVHKDKRIKLFEYQVSCIEI